MVIVFAAVEVIVAFSQLDAEIVVGDVEREVVNLNKSGSSHSCCRGGSTCYSSFDPFRIRIRIRIRIRSCCRIT